MTVEVSARETWLATLGQLELELPRNTFDTWLKESEGVAFRDMDLLVTVPSVFVLELLEQRLYGAILRTLRQVSGRQYDVRFQVPAQDAPPAKTAAATPFAADTAALEPADHRSVWPPPDTGISFSAKYSFANFVVGNSNRMAFSAAQAVADAPGQTYNPLFLYSDVGLGKTHLLHAIGQQSARRGQTVRYVSSEQFANEFISAIRNGATEEFRHRYRSVHLLLIDDVQFLNGKEQTQEAFFHTFNDLHTGGYQIVLTSDRAPKSLALTEDRLRSRYEWGLIADMKSPDLETRMAILYAKADDLRVDLDPGIVELIAKRVQKNVRELEGSLNRVVASARFNNTPITLDCTSRLLDDITARHAIDPERIIEQVAAQYKVSPADLLGDRRTKTVALARQVAMYLLIYELNLKNKEVGDLLGGKNHSTVSYGAGKINAELNEDNQLRQDVLNIKEAIFT